MEIMILPFIGIFYIRNCVHLKTNPILMQSVSLIFSLAWQLSWELCLIQSLQLA